MINGNEHYVSPGCGCLCVRPGRIALWRLVLLLVSILSSGVTAQTAATPPAAAPTQPTRFRVGEKLTYYVSFANFENSAYAELCVASSGKLGGVDAVELRSKIKTLDMVSAAFFLVDESRVVFASAETGLPLYEKVTANDGLLPKETVTSHLTAPATDLDLLTLIYKIRSAGDEGSFVFTEDGKTYNITFRPEGNEKVKTVAGDFETTVLIVESDYLTVKGITELKINFSSGDDRIPVLFRGRANRGEFRASLASVQIIPPATPPSTPTPKPSVTPKPKPTPAPYVENQPLLPELGFSLGEMLDYKVTTGIKPVATVTLKAAERKLFEKADSLLLTAKITGVDQDNLIFSLGDSIAVHVTPDTLAPISSESKFGPGLAALNQAVKFDPRTGFITYARADPFDAPIGTHTILSLVYAMRSFNLRPSKDPSNPINDTRVAVFWEPKAYIFTLRPSNPETITINGEKVSAQMISINTGNQQLDSLALKVWLSMDEGRVPLRFSIGAYQADLVSQSIDIQK